MHMPGTIARRTLLIGALAAGMAPRLAAAAAFTSSRLTVTVQGAGPDVILIHGLDSSRGVWNGTLPALAGYRCHLVQIAGFAGVPAGGNAKGPIVGSLATVSYTHLDVYKRQPITRSHNHSTTATGSRSHSAGTVRDRERGPMQETGRPASCPEA